MGASLAGGAIPGRVLHLSGDLGSGKTTLARGLICALGHAGRVKSPSYTLVEDYELPRLHLYHFDFYRFKDDKEWVSSGFREYFGPDALCIVEWPERASGLLATPDLSIELQFSATGRVARVRPEGSAGSDWFRSSGFSSPSS